MEHKLAKLKLCVTELKLMNLSHFIEILKILTKCMVEYMGRLSRGSTVCIFHEPKASEISPMENSILDIIMLM